jgi:hypothetical protein
MTIADDQGTSASLAKVQQVLDAIEAAEISPEDALQIALALVNFVEEFHLEALEELLQADQPEAMSVAVWAADAARLENVRLQLSAVLGDEDDGFDDGAEDEADDEAEDF